MTELFLLVAVKISIVRGSCDRALTDQSYRKQPIYIVSKVRYGEAGAAATAAAHPTDHTRRWPHQLMRTSNSGVAVSGNSSSNI